jgi:Dyp-type peroxidase family
MGGSSVTMTTNGEVEFSDVQGLMRFGYRRMTKARYVLLRVKDAAAARRWLASANVNTAELKNSKARESKDKPPTTALHIAFTASGLDAIGVPESVIAMFSHEFRTGMATEYRARQLGDLGANAHGHWDWGPRRAEPDVPSSEPDAPVGEPHVLVMFFAEPEEFDDHLQRSTGEAWDKAFEVQRSFPADVDLIEHFGFKDGVSQPKISWDQKRETPKTQLDYTNVAALGEFLLGYRNEYGKFTDRPLLKPGAGNAELLDAVDAPGKKDLARNGTYLVMRQLRQDFAEAEKLATAMVGRALDGDPLVPIQMEPIPGVDRKQNQFTFDNDAAGTWCPFGSHARRANPRNTDFPGRPANWLKKLIISLGFGSKDFGYDLASSVRFHRILRRGRNYGTRLKPEDALSPPPPDEGDRGLHFMCLNANISRQFEFVQNAWFANTKFSGMTGESDPLLGNREPIPGCPVTSDFNMPQQSGLRQRVSGLPQFIKVVGGAYFFLPSLRALRYFAGDKTA